MNAKLVYPISAALVFLACDVAAFAQTFTNIMSGENSEAFTFLYTPPPATPPPPRSIKTTLQSPFGYPGTHLGANDTLTYPNGNASATPPWWFYYTNIGGVFRTYDLTGVAPTRNPSIGQTSFQKTSVYGIRSKAAFSGSVSGTSGTVYEAIYFGERREWAGQREFGFFRQMTPSASLDKLFFYWSVNSNCGVGNGNGPNQGYPWCRATKAVNGVQENPATANLFKELLVPTQITGLTTGTTYNFVGYLFWASWDSTYKFRVEVWNATYTTQITAFNVDTSSSGVNFAASTAGMNGYVTLGIQRADPNGALSNSGVQLVVSSIAVAN